MWRRAQYVTALKCSPGCDNIIIGTMRLSINSQLSFDMLTLSNCFQEIVSGSEVEPNIDQSVILAMTLQEQCDQASSSMCVCVTCNLIVASHISDCMRGNVWLYRP